MVKINGISTPSEQIGIQCSFCGEWIDSTFYVSYCLLEHPKENTERYRTTWDAQSKPIFKA